MVDRYAEGQAGRCASARRAGLGQTVPLIGDAYLRDCRIYMQTLIERARKVDKLFIAVVCIPTLIAGLYFGFISQDVYLSESRFVVRSPEKPSTAGLGGLLKSAGFSNAGDEIYATHDYILSRDALTTLNKGNAFANAYGNENISIFNRFNPLGSNGSFEKLFKYYKNKVEVEHNTASSITTLTVRAFSARDAHNINLELLEQAEALVNRLNARGRTDLVSYALSELEEAKKSAREAAAALSAYRNREGVVDPEKQATVQLQMISKLQDELIATKTQLLQLRAFTPQNPQIPVLQARVKDLGNEIDGQLGMIAGDTKSLAATAVNFQRLQLESQIADRQMAAAMTSLQDARNEARRKQAYVERIVLPNTPDSAIEPRRMRGILATFALGLVLWGVFSMLLAGIKEHND
jgi:capsular polysaccharide transport system permease protein